MDALLDDPVFFAPFAPFFDPRLGRPSTPMEVYLRLMFLKFRYRLGYETPVPRGRRFDHLAAVLPDPARRPGAAPDHADEADHPLRHRRGGRVQRGAAGQGGRGEAAAHHPAARRHHRRPGRCGLPDRLRAAGQGGAADRRGRAAGPGRRRGDPNQGAGPQPSRRGAGPGDRREAAAARARRPATRPRPWFAGSPASWPGWPSAPRPRPSSCWSTPAERCAAPRPRPASSPRPAARTRPRDVAAAGCAARSTT